MLEGSLGFTIITAYIGWSFALTDSIFPGQKHIHDVSDTTIPHHPNIQPRDMQIKARNMHVAYLLMHTLVHYDTRYNRFISSSRLTCCKPTHAPPPPPPPFDDTCHYVNPLHANFPLSTPIHIWYNQGGIARVLTKLIQYPLYFCISLNISVLEF